MGVAEVVVVELANELAAAARVADTLAEEDMYEFTELDADLDALDELIALLTPEDLFDEVDELFALLILEDLDEADELFMLEDLDKVVKELLLEELCDELFTEVEVAFTAGESVDDVDGKQYLQTAIKAVALTLVKGEIRRGLRLCQLGGCRGSNLKENSRYCAVEVAEILGFGKNSFELSKIGLHTGCDRCCRWKNVAADIVDLSDTELLERRASAVSAMRLSIAQSQAISNDAHSACQ